jgi:hypothetical protein
LWHRQILQQAVQVLSTDARDALEESSQCQVHFIAIWLRVWPIWVNPIVFQVPAIHIIESGAGRGGGSGGGGGGTAKAEQILKDFAYSMCEGSMCFMVQYIVCYIACYIVYNIAGKLSQYIACYITCYIACYITSKSCYMTYCHIMCYM